MQNLYLIRHGQANFSGGTENYDKLSPLGKMQASLLADFFYINKIFPDFVYIGELQRHLETATPLLEKFSISPDCIQKISALNEFTPGLWKGLARMISPNHLGLQKDLQLAEKKQKQNPKKATFLFFKITHTLLTEWRNGVTPSGEISYLEFVERIQKFKEEVLTQKKSKQIFIFSSGTPLSILISHLLGMNSSKDMDWMYSLWNTSLSTFKGRVGDWKPITINNLPHIPDISRRTMV
jgi:broad specificity phosphatase PhoE